MSIAYSLHCYIAHASATTDLVSLADLQKSEAILERASNPDCLSPKAVEKLVLSGGGTLRDTTVFLAKDAPDLWYLLMTKQTIVPLTILGTRQVTSDGNTDGLLKPCYAKLLPKVNAERQRLGLAKCNN